MNTSNEIAKAIEVHKSWKIKLKQAIETGLSESTPEKVKLDCHCGFGKWLHNRIDPSVKGSLEYRKTLSLHADFHKAAGNILELALSGKKSEAMALMGIGSEFTKASSTLLRVLEDWKLDI